MYFAYVLDLQNPKQATSQLLKLGDLPLKSTEPSSKQFALIIRNFFSGLTSKDEYLLDLHDYIC